MIRNGFSSLISFLPIVSISAAHQKRETTPRSSELWLSARFSVGYDSVNQSTTVRRPSEYFVAFRNRLLQERFDRWSCLPGHARRLSRAPRFRSRALSCTSQACQPRTLHCCSFCSHARFGDAHTGQLTLSSVKFASSLSVHLVRSHFSRFGSQGFG